MSVADPRHKRKQPQSFREAPAAALALGAGGEAARKCEGAGVVAGSVLQVLGQGL